MAEIDSNPNVAGRACWSICGRLKTRQILSNRLLADGLTGFQEAWLGYGYCPPPAAETPTTICVPPSSWMSLLAPSRMLEAWAILGSCCPGALFASSTPGIAVVRIAMLPFVATTVPAAGRPVPVAGLPLAPCASALPLLAAFAPVAPGLAELLVGGALMAAAPLALAGSAPPDGVMD